MIEIEVAPNLAIWGNFILSWHGVFSVVGVLTAVYLVGRWAPLRGIDPDDIYSIAVWAIIGGIVGARLVHVMDQWGFYQDNPGQILAIWEGGIGLWGGILGGFTGGALYSIIAKHPVGVIADLTAPALLIAQTIGRLGDIVNGEHCAKAIDFFLGFAWTNPTSDAQWCGNGVGVSVHPVIAYEMVWNMLTLYLVWKLRNKLTPPGMIFTMYLSLYAVGRFIITFAREDKIWAIGLQEAHYIALVVLAITIPILLFKARLIHSENAADAQYVAVSKGRGTRAQRRRRVQGR